MFKKLFLSGLLIGCIVNGISQQLNISPHLLSAQWKAAWINCPGSAQKEYGVYHFRKSFELSVKPASFIVHVTADNRYRFFVNDQAVCSGPARGDLFNWYFETVDIASFLTQGNNTISALVWNMGTLAPVGQISNQTGFLLQGNTANEEVINTNNSWLVYHNLSYSPCSADNGERLRTYMVVGPGDQVDAAQYPWGWQKTGYDDSKWQHAKVVTQPVPVGYGTDNQWTLAPRSIPVFKESVQRIPVIRRSEGISIGNDFLKGNVPITIPPNKRISILFDQTYNTAAYPEIITSKGENASVKMTYAEALFNKDRKKGNRNEIDGKEIMGNFDVLLPDGGTKRLFRPLWFRTYRYLQLDIVTKDDTLIIEDLYGMKTGYPLEMNASFSSNDQSLQDIWNVGWRTAQLCAGELYFDTPYYEQLQYTGDSRIQALISLYVSGDDRLMRKAITDFYHSRTPEGLTQGRYPSNRLQIIPTFSLFWVSMIYDYWMHRGDPAFVEQFFPAINEILAWYRKHIDNKKQMLGPMKWWNFVDWDAFEWGVPPGALDGNSSIISLQFSYTLNQAAELFKALGNKVQAVEYVQLAKKLSENTYRHCFVQARNLLANTPDKNSFSQHASIWGILSGAIPQHQAKEVMTRVLKDKTIGQVTFFYRFYLTQALKKAGMADRYFSELSPWRDMLSIGLTTFAEKPEPTRSDCHAWSASPNYDFLATICGIMPGAPGFAKVIIQPAPGELTTVHGTMPHPSGKIEVSIKRKGENGIEAAITLPENVDGSFIWKGKVTPLRGGKQLINSSSF